MIDMNYVFEKYSKCMDGTDCQDQNINKYNIGIPSKN